MSLTEQSYGGSVCPTQSIYGNSAARLIEGALWVFFYQNRVLWKALGDDGLIAFHPGFNLVDVRIRSVRVIENYAESEERMPVPYSTTGCKNVPWA